MAPVDFSAMHCSVARALEVIGERWSLLIVRDAMYGVRRFEEFQKDLGVARNILTDRLAKLVDEGVLERHLYEDRPPRYEYRLTEKGRDLLPALLALMQWGDKWSEDEPPTTVTHLTCGHVTQALCACGVCGEEIKLRDVMVEPLPAVVAERLTVAR